MNQRLVRLALGGMLSALTGLAGCRPPQVQIRTPAREPGFQPWPDQPGWTLHTDGKSRLELGTGPAPEGMATVLNYQLTGGYGFVEIWRPIAAIPQDRPLTFLIQADAPSSLELKFVDADGSVFGHKIELTGQYREWTPITLYWNNFEYWWSGTDDQFSTPAQFYFAVSGTGQGTVRLARVGPGPAGLAASFPPSGPQLDPDRNLAGIGFRARRAQAMIPEDPLVLEWLKQAQDNGSPMKQLVPNLADDSVFQTFNNSLAAMAFILKGERERAERILDFYAHATDRDNTMLERQNFFFRGEARGFYQNAKLQNQDGHFIYVDANHSDRWMGDMAWLLFAYLHYRQEVDANRYREIIGLLDRLLVSYYTDAADGPGGYIRHGWRAGDSRLHEPSGHPEGNIDCFAVMKLLNRNDYAARIRQWLDRQLKGTSLPLDLYTWRVLAFGPDSVRLLDVPDFDLRYRKTLTVRGQPVAGFFHAADARVNNIWLDGVGHIACAYLNYGDPQRGCFYANQLDAFKVKETIGGVPVHGLPYTANQEGGYEWVRPDRGFVSVAAWYILAKNGFNPMTLTRAKQPANLSTPR